MVSHVIVTDFKESLIMQIDWQLCFSEIYGVFISTIRSHVNTWL